jgi:predicted choloylglycine hydrolase
MIVELVQCRGTPHEIGRQQARIFLRTSKGISFARRKRRPVPAWYDFDGHRRVMEKFAPNVWREIVGLAEGLDAPIENAALHFSNGGVFPPAGGCSAVMSNGVYARNYDYRPRHYGARLALVQPEGSYASIGSTEMLTGRLDGMNEHGLCVGLHLVRLSPRGRGLSPLVIVRLLLEQCATTAEAVSLSRRIPHALRYNYSILDAQGQAAVVEAAPGMVAVRSGPWLACTNHFQSPLLKSLNRRAAHSIKRLPPLEQWAQQGLDADSFYARFNASTSPAFHHGYGKGAGTLHTLVGEPATRRVSFGVGGDAAGRSRLDLDFAAWCAGKSLTIPFLSGQLGGKTKPFAWPAARKRKAD